MLATVPIKYKKSKIISCWNWFSRFSSEFAAAPSIMMDPDDFQIFISKKETNRTGKLNEIKLMNTVKRVIYCRSRTRIFCSRQRQKLDSFRNIWITKAAEQQLLLLRSCGACWWQREETVEFVLSPFLSVVIQSYAWRTSDIHNKIEVFYRVKCLYWREI